MNRTSRHAIALVGALSLLGSGCAWLQRGSHTPANATVGVTSRASVSTDGRYVAYAAGSDTSAPGVAGGIYRWDTTNDSRALVSVNMAGDPADDTSDEPSMTPDGRYVAFSSDADDLVANDTNTNTDVFVRDMVAKTTERVSLTSAGVEVDDASYSPAISADGRYVAFISESDDLSPLDQNLDTDAYIVDRVTHTVTLASRAGGLQPDFGISDIAISGDGKRVAFTTDTDLVTTDQNASDDVYVRNIGANSTTRISRSKTGDVEAGGGWSPSLSFDGRYVAFVGNNDIDGAADPFSGPDVFVRDTVANTVTRVSTTPAGGFVNGMSDGPVITPDGKRVVFRSTGNVSGNDANGSARDTFVKDLPTGKVFLVSTELLLRQQSADTFEPSISADGRYAAFVTPGKLSADDPNDLSDVYLRAIDVPTVSAIAPTSTTRGATVTLTITGTNFLPGATVLPTTGVFTVTSSTFVSSTSIKVTLAIDPAAPKGKQTLMIPNPGTGPGPYASGFARCEDCVTVN